MLRATAGLLLKFFNECHVPMSAINALLHLIFSTAFVAVTGTIGTVFQFSF
jgi:hypothetical protein